jgi:hypothetical protein
MNLRRRQFLHLATGAFAAPAIARHAFADIYPSRPVRLICGFAPAGGNDIIARLTGQWLTERLGMGAATRCLRLRRGGHSELGIDCARPGPPLVWSDDIVMILGSRGAPFHIAFGMGATRSTPQGRACDAWVDGGSIDGDNADGSANALTHLRDLE